ncbi:TatD family hydrolase [Candidatus Saccharibacteria bacterium]|nr:TatD family hydrolase [Candidatus Saccharibacteria bacterium]
MLIDTHCHIHEEDYPLPIQEVLAAADHAGVGAMICVGTNAASSRRAVQYAQEYAPLYAAIGVHPHDSTEGTQAIAELAAKQPAKLVAIGEIGLDYHYTNSPPAAQQRVLEEQLQLAAQYSLPVSFHVREAFDDFWPILANFPSVRGVLHSFTDTAQNAERAVARGLYLGVNGISTFTKSKAQQAMFASIPLERLLLETDAPFLTPVPFRGRVNMPSLVREVAQYHATVRGISFEEIAAASTANAQNLFSISKS